MVGDRIIAVGDAELLGATHSNRGLQDGLLVPQMEVIK